MDKQLLKALDNLYFALDEIAEALKQGKSQGAKSSTAAALSSSNLDEHFKNINISLKSIKSDTQEILKNQKTLLSMSKSTDKKTGVFEEAGGDKKSESKIKQGVGTILLIAVAVLAIGLAFKIVGKVDFLSVIALSLSIVLIAVAFEKIAKLELSPRQAMTASAVMVIGSLGIMLSSYILSKIATVTIPQILTAAAITGLFLLVAPSIAKMIKAMTTPTEIDSYEPGGSRKKTKTSQLEWGTLIKSVVMVPFLMVSMSIGIALSSKILSMVTPISIPQALTAVLIGVMFAVIAKGMAGLLTALTSPQESKGALGFKSAAIGMAKMAAAAVLLPFVMVAIATGITWSSKILSTIKPIGFMQAITAILIAGMFAVVSSGISKLIKSLDGVQMTSILLLPILMLAIAGAIAGAAFIFFKSKAYFDGLGFLTILKILLVGATMGVISIIAAYAVKVMKGITWSSVLQLPILFTLLSLAVATSAFILFKAKPYFDGLEFRTILKILALGVVMGAITIIAAIAIKIMGNVSWSQILKLPVLFTLISLALAASAFILMKAKSSFDKMDLMFLLKLVLFGVAVAIAVAVMGLVVKLFSMIGVGVTDAIKGGLVIVILAGVIALTSVILNMGTYKKFPSWKWSMSVALSLGAFGIGALLLGTQALNPFFYAGLGLILLVSGTIVATSHILSAGKYSKYPNVSWALGVGATLGAFGLGAVLLGFNVLNPFFYPGLGMIKDVARTIVDVSKILSKGKYNIPGMVSWAAATALLYTVFTPIILILGTVGVAAKAMSFLFGDGANPFEAGRKMMKDIAHTIVDVSFILAAGKYTGGPTKAWAEGIAIALGAFAPVYQMLVRSAIFKAFGASGVGPKEFAEAIKTVSKGIVTAAYYFSTNKAAFKNGPPKEWSEGVGLAIGSFAPVFKVMEKFPFTGGKKIAGAMKHVAHAIIEVARVLSKGKANYEEGKYPSEEWAAGVGASLKAFSPIFDYMFENSSIWGNSDSQVINNMTYGMISIAKGISGVAKELSKSIYDKIPSKNWAWGVSRTVKQFLNVSDSVSKRVNESNIGILKYVVSSIVRVAKILHGGSKYFNLDIDPFYMRKVGRNILDFNSVLNQLAKQEDKGFFGNIGQAMGSFMGTDPISQIARRMITLAKGYDAMANSLMKLGKALKMLNIKSLSQLGSITRGLSTGQPVKGEMEQSRPMSGKKFGERESDGMPTVKTKDEVSQKKMNAKLEMKNNIWYVSLKLEETVELLKKINKNTQTIDEYIAEVTDGKIKPPPEMQPGD